MGVKRRSHHFICVTKLEEPVINLIGLRFVWAELIFRGMHHVIRTRCLCRKGWHLNMEQHNLKRKITCRQLHERARAYDSIIICRWQNFFQVRGTSFMTSKILSEHRRKTLFRDPQSCIGVDFPIRNVESKILLYDQSQKGRQCTSNATFRSVGVITVAVEKQ